ncbi:MAG: hypothetical protein K9J21_12280 [Bacteroidales bacterium]|nr:hypothetical protein [Bacteroidales bacterium]
MHTPQTIASIGFIEKKEKLSSLKAPVNHNEFIMESVRPFPGYYSPQHVPNWGSERKTNSLYLIIKPFECFNEARITRITQDIRKSIKNLEAAPGRINLSGKNLSCIRLHLKSPYSIPEITEKYAEYNVNFHKKRKISDIECMIKIQKFINMKLIEDNIYQDTDNPATYYILSPKELSWDNFEAITIRVKNSLRMYTFDAALGNIYQKNGFIDFLRIYSPDLTSFEMEKIRDKYLSFIE